MSIPKEQSKFLSKNINAILVEHTEMHTFACADVNVI